MSNLFGYTTMALSGMVLMVSSALMAPIHLPLFLSLALVGLLALVFGGRKLMNTIG